MYQVVTPPFHSHQRPIVDASNMPANGTHDASDLNALPCRWRIAFLFIARATPPLADSKQTRYL
jgi:hypothetical protein